MADLFDTKKDKVEECIRSEWTKTIVPTLCEYISIPNQSPDFDSEWATNGLIEKAMNLLVDWVKTQPLKNVVSLVLHQEPGRTPFLLIEIDGCSDSTNTVLMYGHMDKQPPMDNPPWAEGLGPYIPVIRDGKLYGRGGADDGYSVCAAVSAIVALQQNGIPHGRIVITIEGCEESGSADLDYYMEKCKAQIGDIRLIICLDSGAFTYDRMWLTGSLRGITCGLLEVHGIKEGIHSGLGGGICPCPFRVARLLLDRIEDSTTGNFLVDELKVASVPEHALEGFRRANGIDPYLFIDQYSKTLNGVQAELPREDQVGLLIRNNWHPCVTVVGVDGYPASAEGGNVIRTVCKLKLSIRLPPGVDEAASFKVLKEKLESNPPYNMKVTYSHLGGGNGWCAKALPDWLQKAVDDGSQHFFGNTSGYCAIGGSIPFMKMLGDWYPQAAFVITGVLGPESNAHGPNEFLHIDFATKLTCAVSKILASHYQNLS